jgi:hypothetical protein
MKIITGKAKVKDTSDYIYKGLVLDIIGAYIQYKNGSGMGVYPDGSTDFRLSLEGYDFGYKTTVINDYFHLDILELRQTIVLPFDLQESTLLVQFTKENQHLADNEVITEFIKKESKQIPHPIYDLTSLYDDPLDDKIFTK